MKNSHRIIAMCFLAIAWSGEICAQKTTEGVSAQKTDTGASQRLQRQVVRYDSISSLRLKELQVKVNEVNERLKKQAKNLNKVYRDVSVEVEEELNNREDSIYLSILSEKRTIELEIVEVKKSAEIVTVPSTVVSSQQINQAIPSSLRPSPNKKGRRVLRKKHTR